VGASYQLTNLGENLALCNLLAASNFILPSGVYVCLFGATPGDSDAFASELSTTIASRYNRVQGFFSATAPANDGFAENATDALFPTAGAAWPTVVALGLAAHATEKSGSLIWWGGLQTVQTVLVNQRAKVAQGDLDVTVD
jgi:hypothetical protein